MKIMKIKKYLFLLLSLVLFINCSSTETEVNENITPQTVEKNLLKMTGDDNHWLNYENGKINKAWSAGNTNRSQFTYNTNGTVLREYIEGTGNPNSDNENFQWQIPFTGNYYENIYDNGKLILINRIESGISWKLIEYTYQGNLIVEKKEYHHGNHNLARHYQYIYNSDNKLTTIIWDETPGGGTSHTLQVTFDDKINPYYKIWSDTKITFWDAPDGPARYNLEFYPHNILNLQKSANDVWYNVFYTYDADNYPITMYINEGVQAGNYNYFEYQ
jgi:hypothetical protein